MRTIAREAYEFGLEILEVKRSRRRAAGGAAEAVMTVGCKTEAVVAEAETLAAAAAVATEARALAAAAELE